MLPASQLLGRLFPAQGAATCPTQSALLSHTLSSHSCPPGRDVSGHSHFLIGFCDFSLHFPEGNIAKKHASDPVLTQEILTPEASGGGKGAVRCVGKQQEAERSVVALMATQSWALSTNLYPQTQFIENANSRNVQSSTAGISVLKRSERRGTMISGELKNLS